MIARRADVGGPYVPGRTLWPPVQDVDPRRGGLVLRLFWSGPSPDEVRAVRAGAVDVALAVQNGVVFFLYRIEGAGGWAAQPVSWRGLPPEDQWLPAAPAAGLGAEIHLVDADTGVLMAARDLRLSTVFAAHWHAALAADLAGAPWAGYDARLQAVYAVMPGAEGLAGYAVVLETAHGGPAPGGS